MAFFTRQDIGRLYVIKMVLPDGSIVHKIGMTNTCRAVDRMMEILRSWFTKYRFVPYSELKLDMECNQPRKLEKFIHRVLLRNRFEPNEQVSGGTEMFIDIDEFRVLHYLKTFNEANFQQDIELSDAEYDVLGKLLSQ